MTSPGLHIKNGMTRVTTEYGVVLLDADTGTYWHANAVAGLVLDCIDAGMDERSTVARVRERFDVDYSVARADIEALIARLSARGILV